MSEVLPFSEAEQRGHYADGGDGQIPLTCRLQDTGNFYGSSGQGGGKRPPNLARLGAAREVSLQYESMCPPSPIPAAPFPFCLHPKTECVFSYYAVCLHPNIYCAD
ncbi:unnamed protein product [Staurois parvus]|uniref:Uncharacterized protein n=1 Tax=Staurois parvus TaxID=386267 RepID=A0ABN9D744_9NEOB|nr:unnamed protein product [Staurois parvus]